MDAQKDRERQTARRRASDPLLHFLSRREMQIQKEKQLEKIIRDLERSWSRHVR